LKAVQHIVISSAETLGVFNTDFDRVNLHRSTKIATKAVNQAALSPAACDMPPPPLKACQILLATSSNAFWTISAEV
jgi:hypothetical protein